MKTFKEFLLESSFEMKVKKYYDKIRELRELGTEEAMRSIEIIEDKIRMLANKN